MAFTTKLLRMQLEVFKPFINGATIEMARSSQDKLGKLMARTQQSQVEAETVSFDNFAAEWVRPKKQEAPGVILYLHGGGYVAGDLEYAKGFGSILAAKTGVQVFCAAYRLAPEHPYPAAVDDAEEAYRYLLDAGYPGSQIVLAGESAGGGLLYALALRLRRRGLSLPAGFVAISPWTDLTMSGASYADNQKVDPSMTRERLAFFAEQYVPAGQDARTPEISPLFGDLTGFPPSILFVGGDEVMLDDARGMADRLRAAGCRAELHVSPGMWHAYILYGVREAQLDEARIAEFVREVL